MRGKVLDMKNVLHYAPGFKNGGIESRLLDWYRNIDKSEFKFILVKLNNLNDSDNIKEFQELGGCVYSLPEFTPKNFFLIISEIKKIMYYEKIDIVHVHDLSSGLFVLRQAKKLGIKKRIVHSRTTDYLPNEKNIWFKEKFKKYTVRYATDFYACSVEAFKWGFGDEIKARVIKNGIQIENYFYNNDTRNRIRKELGIENKLVIGSVSRLSAQKNIQYLFNIIEKFKKYDDNIVLLIVGGGDIKQYESEATRRGIGDYVKFLGNKKNVWDYYMAMDLFCGASLYEGFGTTAIEAQATGLPTIVSTGFPASIEVSSFVKRIDLFDEEQWIEQIKIWSNKRFPQEGISAIKEEGFDAKLVAKSLEKIYLGEPRYEN